MAPIVQHLIGLDEGTMVYALLVRRGARRLAGSPGRDPPGPVRTAQLIMVAVPPQRRIRYVLLVTALYVLAWKEEEGGPARSRGQTGCSSAQAGGDPDRGPRD